MLQNDIFSLSMCFCRPGHIAYLMNAFTGERHAYATLFMQAVLSSIWLLLFVWYDINCQWSHSFLKWLALQTAELKAKAAKLHFPAASNTLLCPQVPTGIPFYFLLKLT